MYSLEDVKIINVPTVHDFRGKLAVAEKETLPFNVKRIYYLYDVPSDAYRGGHAHKVQSSLLIALSGSFEVILRDGQTEKHIVLNKADRALYIPNGIWREIENFSSGSICLVLASTEFEESDYIREYDQFLLSKRA